jgi:hypothetical protein
MRGGSGVTRVLAEIAERVSQPWGLRVGFLENATYPDGKPVAMIAMIQEFGAPRAGIPPRPFFRNMIAAKQGEWPAAVGDLIVDNDYDVRAALDQAGFAIAGQLRQSIRDLWEPPLAASTVARKGFDKPLVDTGHMLNSVDHEVVRRS